MAIKKNLPFASDWQRSKNVGRAREALIAERNKNGPFKSIEDLCRRADPQSTNRRVLESLIKAGALDSLGNRGALLNSIDRILSLAQTEQKLRNSGQATMFDLFGQAVSCAHARSGIKWGDRVRQRKIGLGKGIDGSLSF